MEIDIRYESCDVDKIRFEKESDDFFNAVYIQKNQDKDSVEIWHAFDYDNKVLTINSKESAKI